VSKAKQRNNSHIVKIILILLTIFLALLLIFVPKAKASYTYTPSNFKILSLENSKLEIYFPIKENKTKEKIITVYIFPETPNTDISEYLKVLDQFIYTIKTNPNFKDKSKLQQPFKEIYILDPIKPTSKKLKRIYVY